MTSGHVGLFCVANSYVSTNQVPAYQGRKKQHQILRRPAYNIGAVGLGPYEEIRSAQYSRHQAGDCKRTSQANGVKSTRQSALNLTYPQSANCHISMTIGASRSVRDAEAPYSPSHARKPIDVGSCDYGWIVRRRNIVMRLRRVSYGGIGFLQQRVADAFNHAVADRIHASGCAAFFLKPETQKPAPARRRFHNGRFLSDRSPSPGTAGSMQ